jgi:hypothetical protein
MNDNSELNRILHERHVPPAASNLAERIKSAATIEQNVPFYQVLLGKLTTMMIIPKPAYALAAILVMGIALTSQMGGEQMGAQIDLASNAAINDLFTFPDYAID